MADPNAQLEPTFKIPTVLEERVHFWAQIYSLFPNDVKVVHDRNDLSIVYGYIDLRTLPGRLRYNRAYVAKIEAQVLKQLRINIGYAFALNDVRPVHNDHSFEIRRYLKGLGLSDSETIETHLGSIRTQRGQKDSFLAGLKRSQPILSDIENIFAQNGLPRGLTRIPFVESSFNNIAQSAAGAFGMWQFMPQTARQYLPGKRKKNWMDPLVQAQGAARLLANYFRILNDWGLAITSYNSGVGRIGKLSRELATLSGSELIDSPETNHRLGFAGKNFLSEVLAANLVEAYKTHLFNSWFLQDPSCKQLEEN